MDTNHSRDPQQKALLRPHSSTEKIVGEHVVLRPLQEHDARELFQHLGGENNAYLWECMNDGPFHDLRTFTSYINSCADSADQIFWAVEDRETMAVVGHLCYIFTSPVEGTIEIGRFIYSKAFQGHRGTTEAWALLADRAFALGYKTVWWRARAFKARSNQADPIFGHCFEGWTCGIHMVKGRVYDTAGYYMTTADWMRNQESILCWIANR